MVVELDGVAVAQFRELRYRSTPFRVRGFAGPAVVVDSRSARLVWEPRRVTPVYAVPVGDVRVPIVDRGAPRGLTPGEARRPVLDPSVPFDAHTAAGSVLELGDGIAAFSCTDTELEGFVLIDFDALTWFEEETEVFAHPRDPAQRIDVRRAASRIRLSAGGVPIVDSVRARVLWETMLPSRWYVPAEDVLVPVEPSGTVTWCAYKGRATYRTLIVGDRRLEDVAWVYERPLSDGRDVRGLLGFFAERLEATVDGVAVSVPGMPGA